MTKLDDEVDQIHYKQGHTIVAEKSTPDLIRFAAGILREKTSDPYNKALADELDKRAAEGESPAKDWTVDDITRRTNSSPEFLRAAEAVGQVIRNSAHTLLAGGSADVGRLVMAQLAHKHGLVPRRRRR